MNYKKEIELKIVLAISDVAPKLKVVLKRIPEEVIPVSVFVKNGHVYIYDLFKNKTYSMRHYGKTWALTKEELKK